MFLMPGFGRVRLDPRPATAALDRGEAGGNRPDDVLISVMDLWRTLLLEAQFPTGVALLESVAVELWGIE